MRGAERALFWTWFGPTGSGVGGPAGGGGGQSERGEAGEVGCGGEEVEVGVDFWFASDSGFASAVSAAHEVTDLSFDFGPCGPVVVAPVLVGLSFAGSGQDGFVDPDADGAAARGGGALGLEGGQAVQASAK